MTAGSMTSGAMEQVPGWVNEHVGSARWFGGKGRGGEVSRVVGLRWLGEREGVRVRPEVATWRYPDGSQEQYQLLVAYSDAEQPAGVLGSSSEGIAHDATKVPAALQVLLASLLDGAQDKQWQPVIPDGRSLAADLPLSVYGGEQSNTNVMVGDVAILKLFRKLEPGRNLDIQVHDALGRASVGSAARLYGWVAGELPAAEGEEPVETDYAMVVEQLQDAADGFVMAREACASGADFSQEAAALGEALAEVHAALHDTFDTTTVDGDAVAATMARRLDEAIEAAPVLSDHRDGLVQVFGRLAGHRLPAQRIHGDFHLGQTLRTPDGWRIIDFEGEPMKTLAERRLPDSPWRDVAGMLRSFGYATSGSDDPTGPAARQWLADVRAAFLGAYGEPRGGEADVLSAYEADKATYEVVYEVRNRPDWLPIPMSAISSIAPSRAGNYPLTSGTNHAGPAADEEN